MKAADVSFGLDFILAKHDNVNLDLISAGDEWVSTITGTIGVIENSSNLIADVNASVSVLNYKNDPSQDTTELNLALNTLWIVNPNRFEWLVSDVYTQTLINPLLSDSQSNREDINIFTTGPNYYLRLNSRHNINFDARFENIYYSSTNGDSDRISTALGWEYRVNSTLTNSLIAEFATLDYKDNTLNDYGRNDLFVRVAYQRGRNRFIAEAGVTKLEFESQSDFSEPRYLLSIQNQRTTNSDIFLEFSHRISDEATEILDDALDPQTDSGTPTSVGTDIFLEDNINIRYNKTTNRFGFFAEIEGVKRNYATQDLLDMHSFQVSIQPTINFSQTASLNLEAMQLTTLYDNSILDREDVDTTYILSYNNSFSRNLRWSLSVETE
ncbi:MAG: hypothetical protein KAI84_05670, partial [Gammaproteobacteria bacterium]|nr:hypothetical protein [Gammaproteobacteria bacterium]